MSKGMELDTSVAVDPKGFEVEGLFRVLFRESGTLSAEVEAGKHGGGRLTFKGFKQEFESGFRADQLRDLALMLMEAAERIDPAAPEEGCAAEDGVDVEVDVDVVDPLTVNVHVHVNTGGRVAVHDGSI